MEAFLERWFTNQYYCFAPCATGVEPDWLEDSNLAAQLWTTVAQLLMAEAVGLEPTRVINRRFWRPLQSPLCETSILKWCQRWDSNPYTAWPLFLRECCLPIPAR